MSGRKPLLENDEPLVVSALKEFLLRNQALVLLGLNTGFRITEILSLTVGHPRATQSRDNGRTSVHA